MILFTSRSSSLVVAAITFWAVVTLTSLPNVVRAQSLGMGTCAMPNDFDRDTQGCCVTGAGPTVVTSATEGCCRLSSGFAQVLTLANEGCCLTGPGQQEKIDLTVFGCCNTVMDGKFQEKVEISTTGCCGPDPGLQKKVNYGAGEICCSGSVVMGPTCPSGTKRTDTYAASRFLGHDSSRIDMDIFEEPEEKWKIETATSASYRPFLSALAGMAAASCGVVMLL